VEKKTCVYQVRNLLTGVRYIGVTNNPKRRWKSHQSAKCDTIPVCHAIRLHGVQNFVFEELAWFGTRKEALDEEVRLIAEFRVQTPGLYNATPGGEGIRSPSEETRRKIGDARRRAWQKPEHRALMNIRMKEHWQRCQADPVYAEAHRQRLIESNKRRAKHSKQTT